MTPDVVVDIGNTRMKWGRVVDGRVAEVAFLRHNDPDGWRRQTELWGLVAADAGWAVASVNPPAAAGFAAFVAGAGGAFRSIQDYRELPLRVAVDEPAKVGIDRLLGALAARSLIPPREPLVTVDVGTAVTVNCIDANGSFVGGAILPGPRLMAAALGRGTAALPDLDFHETSAPAPPGRNTADAIRAGIAAAIQGGITLLVARIAVQHPWPWLFLTGGGCGGLANHLIPGCAEVRVEPNLTLEGVRLAAEALP